MPVSRLRLRLAAGFALAFAIGIGGLATGALAFMSQESTRRFDARLDVVGSGLMTALAREYSETPDSSYRFVTGEVAAEWPNNGDAFLFLDFAGAVVAGRDPDSISARVMARVPVATTTRFDIDRDGSDLRARLMDSTFLIRSTAASTRQRVQIVIFGSTEGIEADTERLGFAIMLGVPLILLASLLVGYLLAGRALAPVRQLALDIANIAPTDLSRRLTPQHGDGELGALAAEFDALLVRLADAQQRNRQFVREAAHQIRTPLTLVLGEAGLALDCAPVGRLDNSAADAEAGVARLRATLTRVRTAAEQMRRRVDELFLLAEARSGEVVRLEQRVELDGLVLECTDLMRARAAVTGHTLAIGDAEPLIVMGHAALLQEALLELIENACRHGVPCAPITVSCRALTTRQEAVLEVRSAGAFFADTPPHDQPEHASDRGMGLSIVRWVASSHHGRFEVGHEVGSTDTTASVGVNAVRLILPTVADT